MKIRAFVVLAVLFTSAHGFARGGSVVGNGAGIVEHDFQYAYGLVGRVLRNCLETKSCQLSEKEERIVRNIRQVFLLNEIKTDRLVFISGKDNPGFFDTGAAEFHRIAVTGLNPHTPIYINTDLIYTVNGKPAFDLLTMFSILVHELGHQAGERNHQMLDILAAKLKLQMSDRTFTYSSKIPNTDIRVTINIINQSFELEMSELHISGAPEATAEVKRETDKYLKCKKPSESMIGFEFSNAYFFDPKFYSGNDKVIGFSFWIEVKCFDSTQNSLRVDKKDAAFILNEELQINTVIIKD